VPCAHGDLGAAKSACLISLSVEPSRFDVIRPAGVVFDDLNADFGQVEQGVCLTLIVKMSGYSRV
jgi:hypothetical protein